MDSHTSDKEFIRLGDIKIPVVLKSNKEEDQNGAGVFLYEADKLYVENGAALNNEGVLKIKYDSTNDTFDFGWLKGTFPVYDDNGNAVTDPETGEHLTKEVVLEGKISRWNESDNSFKHDVTIHVGDDKLHMDYEERSNLFAVENLFSLLNIGYSDEEEIIYEPPISGERYTYAFKAYCIKPTLDFQFNTFKIKTPQIEQNIENKVYLKIQKLEKFNDESGHVLGTSNEGIKILSTSSSEGYFEWNFSYPLNFERAENYLFSFVDENDNDIFISAYTYFIDKPDSYILTNDDVGIYYDTPICQFTSKKPNSLYFK